MSMFAQSYVIMFWVIFKVMESDNDINNNCCQV